MTTINRIRRSGLFAVGWLVGAVLVVFGTGKVQPGDGERAVDAAAYAAVLLGCGCVLTARRWPLRSLAGSAVTVLCYAGSGYPDGPVLLPALATLYLVGAARSRTVAYGCAAAVPVGVLIAGAVADGGPGVVDLAFAGWSVAAVSAADAVRSHRERRAARRARDRLLAEARERRTRQRLTEQRLRIARDLHDSVGHAMATITVQAAVAAKLVDDRPDRAKEALEVVRTVGAGLLDELTTMVRVLRDDDEWTPVRSVPGLDGVAGLADAARRAGTPVTVHVAVDREVARPVAVAVYRIVQESLTNVARHATGARATVEVVLDEAAGLRVSVVDDGPAPGPVTAGAGVTGMRERAAATGGHLTAQAGSGGFAVNATWPFAVARATGSGGRERAAR